MTTNKILILKEELEKIYQLSFKWALICCNFNKEDALDTIQTSYIKVIEGQISYQPEKEEFKTWFFKIIRGVSKNNRRQKNRHKNILERWWNDLKPNPVTIDTFIFEDQKTRKIIEIITNLSERQKEVINLVFYYDLTLEEVSYILQISLGSVRTHYDRAKKEIYKKLMESNFYE